MPVATAEYKDRLFTFIFGSPGNEAWTLSLYNAVRGTSYDDPSAVEINTIREALYLGMRNDVSFVIADEMQLFEQQSTYNPNMPPRMLQYAANLYERYIVGRKLNKYGSRLLRLPAPKLVVFYNGMRELADEVTLNLGDSFPTDSDPDISMRVRMININKGHSEGVLGSCEPLMEYSWLVARIRATIAAGSSTDQAVGEAIGAMPADFVIKGFIDQHRAEVQGMLLTEYDEAQTMELFREEGREEGRQEGREEGVVGTLAGLVRDGILTLREAAGRAGMSETEFERLAKLA